MCLVLLTLTSLPQLQAQESAQSDQKLRTRVNALSQAIKENTVTFDYKLFEGFLMRYEWRRDYSNQPSFLTDRQGFLTKDQNTATLGLIWWWG